MDHLSADNQPFSTNSEYPRRRGLLLFRWTPELRNKFDEAVNSLGGAEQASAEDILELMGNVNHLNKTIVASHLQKYKKRAERQSRVRNLEENSAYPADPFEESRRASAYSLEYLLNHVHNSNDTTSHRSIGNYSYFS